MRRYECMYILDPSVEDKEKKMEEIKKLIEEKGKLEDVDVWGIRKLEYPIKRKKEGYYIIVRFETEPSHIPSLREKLNLDSTIMRFIIVKRRK